MVILETHRWDFLWWYLLPCAGCGARADGNGSRAQQIQRWSPGLISGWLWELAEAMLVCHIIQTGSELARLGAAVRQQTSGRKYSVTAVLRLRQAAKTVSQMVKPLGQGKMPLAFMSTSQGGLPA